MSCAPPTVVQCKPAADLAALVRSYQMHNLHNLRGDLNFFRDIPSLECAIYYAGLAINSNGKRFRHQCRIPLAVLRHAKALLGSSETQLKRCHSFCELCSLLSSIFKPVHGLGQLYIYDTALRSAPSSI